MMFAKLIILAITASAPATAIDPSVAWKAAEANRGVMKARPDFVDGPKVELPELEKALGHHGPVVIQGIIDTDGKMKEVRVKVSSRSPALDEIALNAASASTFTPAKDGSGLAIPVITSMPFELADYKRLDGGITKYKCGQFTRDMDWWKSANPEKGFDKHELYSLELGVEMLSMIQRANGNHAALSKSIDGFGDRWNAAIELCRKKPDMLQRDAIYR